MATYLADRVIVFEGTPSVDSIASTPQTLLGGMNRFLELLGITFRRDPNNYRPRINKANSVKVNLDVFADRNEVTQYRLHNVGILKRNFHPEFHFLRFWNH